MELTCWQGWLVILAIPAAVILFAWWASISPKSGKDARVEEIKRFLAKERREREKEKNNGG